jgi:hypothetical protein
MTYFHNPPPRFILWIMLLLIPLFPPAPNVRLIPHPFHKFFAHPPHPGTPFWMYGGPQSFFQELDIMPVRSVQHDTDG